MTTRLQELSTDHLVKLAHTVHDGCFTHINAVVADPSPRNVAFHREPFSLKMSTLGQLVDVLHERGVHFDSDLV